MVFSLENIDATGRSPLHFDYKKGIEEEWNKGNREMLISKF